jgi:DNA modification methylase
MNKHDLICDIYNNNAFRIINNFKDKKIKVHHIITDPPYNISKPNNLNTMQGKRQGVDFGEWDKSFNLLSWIKPYSELLKPGGSFIIFNSFLNISYIASTLEESGLEIKDCIKWIKNNPMPRNIERRYVMDTEFAIWAVKPKAKWVFNRLSEYKYMRSEYKTSTVSGNEKTLHPTQKSLKLMSDLIKVHSNKGDVILDPFMGSGTTGVASLMNKRNFIGVELEKKYFQISINRLSEQSNRVKIYTKN